MEDALSRFDRRCQTVRTRHVRMASGYRTRLRPDGMIEQVPHNRIRSRHAPWAALLALVAGLFGMKLLLVTWLGAETFEAKRATLQAGSPIERAGAAALRIDPVTAAVAGWIEASD